MENTALGENALAANTSYYANTAIGAVRFPLIHPLQQYRVGASPLQTTMGDS